jgi:hypothetical protein
MKRNIKIIKIIIPNEVILNKIDNTPALRQLSRLRLQVGDNIERVNHYQFSQILRMFPIAGAQVIELE